MINNIYLPLDLSFVTKRYNIDIPEKELSSEELSAYKRRESAILSLLRQNTSFHTALLKQDNALAYLSGRGITKATIEKWNLVWAVNGFFTGRQSNFSCNFAALRYKASNINQYAYKMEV